MSLTILLVQQFKAISLKQNSSANIKMKATSKDNRCFNLWQKELVKCFNFFLTFTDLLHYS